MRRADLECAGVAVSIGAARQFVRATLADWDAQSYEWTATTLVSELATNAVLHAGTDFRVSLCMDGASLLLEVADGSPLLPVRRRFATTATTGRGMRLVEELAESWSVTVEGGRKVVSCFVMPSDRTDGEHETSISEVPDLTALLAEYADDDISPTNRTAA